MSVVDGGDSERVTVVGHGPSIVCPPGKKQSQVVVEAETTAAETSDKKVSIIVISEHSN